MHIFKRMGKEMIEEDEMIKEEIDRLENRIEYIKNNPEEFVDSKLSSIQSSLDKIEDREPDDPDNVSMYQHLSQRYNQIDSDRDRFRQNKIDKMEGRIAELEDEL